MSDLARSFEALKEPRAYKPAPPTEQERFDVGQLHGMLGISADICLSVLRRSGGNVEKAASALLEGDTGGFDAIPEIGGPDPPAHGPRTPPPSKPETDRSGVIDLTKDDEDKELSRAIAESMKEQGPTTFGPSNRAPDPNWAVVPSNVETGNAMSQDDQSLSRAIEASLTYDVNMDEFEDIPLEQRVRKGKCPVTLRPTRASHIYAALILQGLFFVPQVRRSISEYRPPSEESFELDGEQRTIYVPPDAGDPEHATWSLLEIFTYLDLSIMGDLDADKIMADLKVENWNNLSEDVGIIAHNLYAKLTLSIEAVLHGDAATNLSPEGWPRLFHFRYGFSDGEVNHGPFDRRSDLSIVKVSVKGTPESNDLLSCLSAELTPIAVNESGRYQVIYKPSEVVAFQLLREQYMSATGSKHDRQKFVFPKFVYLDQFLKENVEVAQRKRSQQRRLYEKVEKLKEKRISLTRHKNRDVLADLRSSLHYFENIADDNNDDIRKVSLKNTGMQLRRTIARIENELQTIDTDIDKCQIEAANIYDVPELQKNRYDLRVVLVHDGLYGRNHVYSYVRQGESWWKIVDHAVTQVTEEAVLNDANGLHLNSGPFLLIYSRAITLEEENAPLNWEEGVKNSVKTDNQTFIHQLEPHLREQIPDIPSVPIAESLTGTPSDLSSAVVEPPSSRDEPMDLS